MGRVVSTAAWSTTPAGADAPRWKNEARRTPALTYDVKHVTINMKVEHYKRMRRDGSNMSRVINTFLDDLYGYSICPSCYQDDFEVAYMR